MVKKYVRQTSTQDEAIKVERQFSSQFSRQYSRQQSNQDTATSQKSITFKKEQEAKEAEEEVNCVRLGITCANKFYHCSNVVVECFIRVAHYRLNALIAFFEFLL